MATANSAVFSAELTAEVAMPTRRHKAPAFDSGINDLMKGMALGLAGLVGACVACSLMLFVFVDLMTHAFNFGALAVGLG